MSGLAHAPGRLHIPTPSPRGVGTTVAAVVLLVAAGVGAWALTERLTASSATQAGAAELAPPMRFEANAGQTHRDVDYLARGSSYTLFLTSDAAVVSMPGTNDDPAHAIHLGFAGANADVEPAGVDQLRGSTSYFTGDDAVAGVPGFGAVEYEGLYPGIDARFHERGEGGLEYLFTVAPGADPSTIRLNVEGAEPSVAPSGDLILSTPAGELRQSAPVLFQEIDGTRHEVSGEYVVRDGGEVGFAVGSYDPEHPLVIDPVLDYSTYLGGGGRDRLTGIVVDDDGAAYVAGHTSSADFPTTPGAVEEEDPGEPSGFVAKLSPDGDALEYSTYFGGSGNDTEVAVALDDDGAAYVTGRTDSDDFPTTEGAVQEELNGEEDAFLVKLSPDGDALEYGTYLGGSGADHGFGVGVDVDGAAHVVGTTESENFPVHDDALQPALQGGTDGFVAKVNPEGSELEWATYLGGSESETASGMAVDADEGVYVAGDTTSEDFPTTDGAFGEDYPGSRTGYVVKFDSAGGQQFGTFVGGSGNDTVGSASPAHDPRQTLDVTADGSAIVVGGTESADFPLTDDAFQTMLPTDEPHDGEATIGYVARLTPDGTDLEASTFLGGRRPIDHVHASDDGTATVAMTIETDRVPAQDRLALYSGNHDAYVAQLSPDATELVFATPLGGRLVDLPRGVAVGPDDSIFFIGDTQSDDFPVTPGAVAPTPPGGLSGHVSRVAPTPEGEPLVTGLAPRSGPESGGTEVDISGRDLADATAVEFGGEPAADFTVESDTQITAVSPPGTGTANVTVTTPGGATPANPITEFTYAEGVWELTGEMATIRFDGSLTLLDDGRVLAAGGRTEIRDGETVETAEVFDPLTGEWSETESMAEPRSHHSATLLDDGRVLVAGGMNADGSLTTAEVFDSDDESWTQTGDGLSEERSRHVAERLDDGRVLITGGGSGGDARPTAEVYDPVADSWATTGSMAHDRTNFAGGVLDDGRVLVAGGAPQTDAAEVYDPGTGEWSEVASMNAARHQHQGTVLDDGRVLMASGLAAGHSAEVYDPESGEWTLSAMIHGRWTALLGTLPSGRVMLAGGTDGGPYAELYDPEANDWESAGVMHRARPSWRNGHRNDIVQLSSDPDMFEDDPDVCGDHCGKLLVAGNTVTREVELYTPRPEVTAVSPDEVSTEGGDEVTITGFALGGASEVRFGDEPATDVTVESSTEITATAPAHDEDTVDVTVTTPGGVSEPTTEAQVSFSDPDAPVADVDRVAGDNRFDTAARLSADAYPDGADVAYVATGFDFPDALTGGVAAALEHGPVLLVTTSDIPQWTADELDRLDPDRVEILGGTAVVDEDVESELAGFAAEVNRLAGPSRFHTAVEVAQARFPDGADTAYLATGDDFPDALAAVSAAADADAPLLLATPDELTEATEDELSRLDPDRIVLLGGSSALDADVEAAAGDFADTVDRLEGATRFHTSEAIALDAFPGAEEIFVATGQDFPDALAGGAVAGTRQAPVLLSATDDLTDPTRSAIDALSPLRATILGGTAAVSAGVETELEGLLQAD